MRENGYSFTLSKRALADIDNTAVRENRSRSNMIKTLLIDALDNPPIKDPGRYSRASKTRPISLKLPPAISERLDKYAGEISHSWSFTIELLIDDALLRRARR